MIFNNSRRGAPTAAAFKLLSSTESLSTSSSTTEPATVKVTDGPPACPRASTGPGSARPPAGGGPGLAAAEPDPESQSSCGPRPGSRAITDDVDGPAAWIKGTVAVTWLHCGGQVFRAGSGRASVWGLSAGPGVGRVAPGAGGATPGSRAAGPSVPVVAGGRVHKRDPEYVAV